MLGCGLKVDAPPLVEDESHILTASEDVSSSFSKLHEGCLPFQRLSK